MENIVSTTLEEAATDYIAAKSSRAREYGLVYDAIKFGAEWQIKRSYSREEVIELLNKARYTNFDSKVTEYWIKENLKK
jgi:hypothetical protein